MASLKLHYTFYDGRDATDWFEFRPYLPRDAPPVPRIGEKVFLRDRYWRVIDIVHHYQGHPEIMIVVEYVIPEGFGETPEEAPEVVPETSVEEYLNLCIRDSYLSSEQAESLRKMGLNLRQLKDLLAQGTHVAVSAAQAAEQEAAEQEAAEQENTSPEKDSDVCAYCGDTVCPGGEECPFYDEGR